MESLDMWYKIEPFDVQACCHKLRALGLLDHGWLDPRLEVQQRDYFNEMAHCKGQVISNGPREEDFLDNGFLRVEWCGGYIEEGFFVDNCMRYGRRIEGYHCEEGLFYYTQGVRGAVAIPVGNHTVQELEEDQQSVVRRVVGHGSLEHYPQTPQSCRER